MIIRNATVYTEDFSFAQLDLALRGDRIARIVPPGSPDLPAGEEELDAQGLYLLPGLVDVHTHGAVGHDWCDADPAANRELLAFYASRGVTSVVPATMSYDRETLCRVVRAMRPLFAQEGHGAVLRGVNLEGPFLNRDKRGAQNPAYLTPPDLALFEELDALSGGNLRLVDVAPELDGGLDFVRAVAGRCTVSLAHTAANYEQAAAAFAAGASHVTHLYNAMPGYHHRDPGVIGAAMDHAAQVELIADGLHLHPSVVRGTFRAFGADRICLISDSMRATGMPDGVYALGGQEVYLQNGKAALADGALAGSAADLLTCCRRAAAFGVPLEQVVRAATHTPARAVGLDHELGRVAEGLRADLLLLDRDLQPVRVLVGGQPAAL